MSIKKNFLYNSILTLSGYFFPLLTYPYVSRVLGVSNIGICNFIDSIVNYFMLFSMMGIATVGMREIALHRDNRQEMSRHFAGLIVLNLTSTILAIIVLIGSMYLVPALFPYRRLLFIGVCKLFFNLLMIEWLFAGIENFEYITKRSITVRAVYVVLIFVFIQSPDDYELYYFLTVSSYLTNGIINIFYSRHYINFSLRGISIKPYLGPFLTIGFYMLITNVYTSLNVVWLGFASGTKEVGYYTTATKLYTIILSMFTALTNVIFPRVTQLYSTGNMTEYWSKINKATEIVFVTAIPIVIFLFIFSDNLVHLLAGDGYEGAYTPFRIISPLILIVGYEQVLVIQILMSMQRDKRITINSVCGAIVSIVFNILIVSHLGAIGTSIVWLTSEMVITTLSLHAIYHYTSYRIPVNTLTKNIAINIPLVIILYLLNYSLNIPNIILLAIASIVTALYAIYTQYRWLKNELVIQLWDNAISIVKNIYK